MVIEHRWTPVNLCCRRRFKSPAYWSSPTASGMEVQLEEFTRTEGYQFSKLLKFDTPYFKLQMIKKSHLISFQIWFQSCLCTNVFQRGVHISPPTLKMCDIKKTTSLAMMNCQYTDFERLTNEGTQMLSSLT